AARPHPLPPPSVAAATTGRRSRGAIFIFPPLAPRQRVSGQARARARQRTFAKKKLSRRVVDQAKKQLASRQQRRRRLAVIAGSDQRTRPSRLATSRRLAMAASSARQTRVSKQWSERG
ncbi:hypothetical protein Dimus_036792, partial [Dionaea muscipula]